MKHSRSLLLLTFACFLHGNSNAQSVTPPPSPKPPVLYLNGSNNGHHVTATVGQAIEITLHTIGPGQYSSPQLSSRAIRFEGSSFPSEQNPGGPTQVYRFHADSAGEAVIKIPHIIHIAHSNATDIKDSNPIFAITILVH